MECNGLKARVMFNQEDGKRVNGLYTDFRGDVIAAGMVDNGIDEDRLVIFRQNGDASMTDKDIDIIDRLPDMNGKEEDSIMIRTNRPGIYDRLPEALFHSGAGPGNCNRDSILETFRRQHREEAFARKFFSLYETEIDRSRIDLSLAELGYDRPGKYRASANTLGRLWPVIRLMDSRTAILFCRTLPHFYRIRNRYAQIAAAMSLITGFSVSIRLHRKKTALPVKNLSLGNMKLGSTSTLRGHQTENYAAVRINASSEEAIRNLLPGASGRLIIDTLLEMLMSVDIPYETILRQQSEVSVSRLGDRMHPCLPGVNAKLKKKEKEKKQIYESPEY
jgi:hypothetical protein